MAKKEKKKRSFKALLNKYKLGSHHKMERFGIISIVLLIALFSSVGLGVRDHMKATHKSFENISIYTQTAESSISGTSFTVDGLWCNTDKTRAYLLLKCDSDSVSYNPEDFIVNLANEWYTKPEKPMSGNLLVFGNTGYIGVEIIGKQGFSNEKLVLTFIMKKNIANYENIPEIPSSQRDERTYFERNDAFNIEFNPAAKSTLTSKYLDGESLTASDLYKVFVTGRQEAALKVEMQNTINQMKVLQDRYNEDVRQLETYSVKTPILPKAIRGDSFTYNEADADWLRENMATVSGQTYFDGKEEVQEDEDSIPELQLAKIKPYRYKSAYTVKGGLDYEWHSTTINDTSYIDLAVPSNMTFEEFIDTIGVDDEEDEYSEDYADDADDYIFMPNETDWQYTDGTAINFESERTEVQNIIKAKDDITSVVSDWISLKQQYQTQYLKQLLLLEDEANAQDETLQSLGDGIDLIYNGNFGKETDDFE